MYDEIIVETQEININEVVPPEPIVIEVSPEVTTVIEVVSTPIAVKGDKGDKGDDGISFASEVFIQSTPADVWTYNHNKGYYPSISVLDLFDRVVNAEIIHNSINQISVFFNIPYTGKIIIN